MSIKDLLEQLQTAPESIQFSETMAVIDANYDFSETTFYNGDTVNPAGQNNGSCKLFAFAQIQGLEQNKTLALFGDYYRIDVLKNPQGEDHANIRNFIEYGWDKVHFDNNALTEK